MNKVKCFIKYDSNTFTNGQLMTSLFANPVTYSMFYDYKIKELGGKIFYDATFIDAILEKNNIKVPNDSIYDRLLKEYKSRSDDIKQNGFIEKKYGEFANEMLKSYLHWF